MNGTVTKTGDSLTIACNYDKALIEEIKTIPGRRFLPKTKTWRVVASTANAEQIQKLIVEHDLECSSQAKTHLDTMLYQKKMLSAMSRVSQVDEQIGETRLAKALRPFQRAGVLYAAHAGRCMIADEMGLGKTLQALATLEKRDAFPAVVICPASLKINWARESKKWLDGKVVRVLDGRSNHILDGADIIIANYEIVGYGKEVAVPSKKLGIPKFEMQYALVELLKRYGVKGVVIDESHYIKNSKAKRTIACQQLCKITKTVLLLTGTPVLNRPAELVAQLRALGTFNSLFGTWSSFAERYCDAKMTAFGWDTSGASNLDELNDRLRSCCFVRRTKSEVLKELPSKTVSTVYTELPAAFAREYQRAEKDLQHYLRNVSSSISDSNVLSKIERLKQEVVAAKLSFVTDWVENFLESGEKLVLFGWHKKEIMQLHTAFKSRSAIITGDTSLEDRQKAVDLFQEARSQCRLLICNINAGGVGLTLTAASNVAFYEFGWNPGQHLQAEDRVHRIGQTDAVTAYYLVAQDTIDEFTIDLIEQKRIVVDEATDGIKRPFKQQKSIVSEIVRRLLDK